MNNHITLWVPGLRPDKQFASQSGQSWPQLLQQLPKKDLPDLENINLLLSRADRVTGEELVKHDFIADLLSGGLQQNNQWPLAQWRKFGDDAGIETGKSSSEWLCADPVYIHPDRSEALLFAHEELDIQLDEAQAIAALINQHYTDDPWTLHVGSTHRWYIELNQPFNLLTSTLQSVKGRNVFEHLPTGTDSHYWQQCMNEIQMLLHNCEVNQQREAQEIMPINSLWFWGYGTSTEHEEIHWDTIYSDNAVLNGLGILSGSKVNNLPDAFEDVDFNGEVLVYDDKLPYLLQQQDIYNWLSELQYLESYWFMPLIARLRDNQNVDVTLLLDNDEAYQLKSKHLKRWWRRSNKNKLF